MILSSGKPKSIAFCADSNADTIKASFITSSGDCGCADAKLASIIRFAKLWSSEPQFTPIRTALLYSAAVRII